MLDGISNIALVRPLIFPAWSSDRTPEPATTLSDHLIVRGILVREHLMELHAEAFSDPVVIPMGPREKNTPDVIFNAFMKLEQSYKDVNILHEQISAYITTVAFPVGQG